MQPLRLLSELLRDLNTSIIIDLERPTKLLLIIEESVYTEMTLKV